MMTNTEVYTDTLLVTVTNYSIPDGDPAAYRKLVVIANPDGGSLESFRLKGQSICLSHWLSARPGWTLLSYRPVLPTTEQTADA